MDDLISFIFYAFSNLRNIDRCYFTNQINMFVLKLTDNIFHFRPLFAFVRTDSGDCAQ